MKSYPSIGQSFGILGIFIVATIVAAIGTMALAPVAGKEFIFFLSYVASVGATFFIANSIRKNQTTTSIFNFEVGDNRVLPYIAVVTLAIPFGLTLPLTSLIPMSDFIKKLVLQIAEYDGVWAFLTIVIAGPILEELIFRGIVLDGFLKRYSPLKSILVSSALFGIFHLNPWQFITAMVLGSFIGWVYYRTRSLGLAIAIHLLNNLTAFVAGSLNKITPENIDDSIIDFYGGVIPFISVTMIALIVIAYGIYLLNEKMDKAPELISEPMASDPSPIAVEKDQL